MMFLFFTVLVLAASLAELLNCNYNYTAPLASPGEVNASASALNNETITTTVVAAFANASTALTSTAPSASYLRRTRAATATPTATPVAAWNATKNNNNNNNIAVPSSPSPVVEEQEPDASSITARNKNKKLEVSLKHVGKDGKTTTIALGSLEEIPHVRRVLTRAPKGRIMLRHPSDPTTTWSVSEDSLYEWLFENGLQWKHDYDFVDSDDEQDDNSDNSDNSNNNNNSGNDAQQQEQEPQGEETAAPQLTPLSLKDAVRASVTNAARQVKVWIRNLLWWTAAMACLAICLWIAVVALTLDMEASRQRNQTQREQEMLRVASCLAATLRQSGHRPFFLCPQQWEEQCLDQAMKQLYSVSYYETCYYRDSKYNSNDGNMCSSSKQVYYGYQQPPVQSQIYRSSYY